MTRRALLMLSLVGGAFATSTSAAGPTFRPDAIFRGSSLAGWNPVGLADWRAQNGEIVGTPKSAEGGWLVLNRSYQDVAFFSRVTCTGGCKAGVLLRAEKIPSGGMKGVYVSLTEGDLVSYAVMIDAQGREAAREPVPRAGRGGGGGGRGAAAGAAGRGAAPADPAGGEQAAGGRERGAAPPPGLPPGVELPGLTRPTGAYLAGQTNTVDITLAGSTVTVRLNGGSLGTAGGAVEDGFGKYGPLALYVGGTAPVLALVFTSGMLECCVWTLRRIRSCPPQDDGAERQHPESLS